MTTTSTSIVKTAAEGYEAIQMQPYAMDTIADAVVLDGVSRNSSQVSANLTRYVWGSLPALSGIITAITVLVTQTLICARLTDTDSTVRNAKAEG